MRKPVKIRWTDIQREVASKAAEGANFENLVEAGYSKSLISKVLRAIKTGQVPPSLGTENREPTSKSSSVKGGIKLPGGESVGGIDETRQVRMEVTPPPQKVEVEVEIPKEEAEEPKAEEAEEPKREKEFIAGVSEVVVPKGKDGKPGTSEIKIATTIADDGLKCTVFLSLKTLALFKIASSTQAQFDGGVSLLLGDFLDTCVADFFSGRGKTLGLINTGGE